MTAGNDAGGAVPGTTVVEEGQGVHHVARPPGGQVAVQSLMAAAHEGLAALDLGEEDALPDQLADHGQYLQQVAHGLDQCIKVQLRGARRSASHSLGIARRSSV